MLWIFTAAGRQAREQTLQFRGIKKIMTTLGLWEDFWRLLSPSSAKHVGRQAASANRLWNILFSTGEHQFIPPAPLVHDPRGLSPHERGLQIMQMPWTANMVCVKTSEFHQQQSHFCTMSSWRVLTTIVQELAQYFPYCAVSHQRLKKHKDTSSRKLSEAEVGRTDSCGWWGLVA